MPAIVLKAGREKSLLRRHPWVFSGAVGEVRGAPASGETVELRSSDGRWLARGAFSPHSQIRVRAWTFNPEEAIEQMELLGHDFYVFFNADVGAINVLYRRKDGNYGLIQPELA